MDAFTMYAEAFALVVVAVAMLARLWLDLT